MRISDWSADVCSSDLSRRRTSNCFQSWRPSLHDRARNSSSSPTGLRQSGKGRRCERTPVATIATRLSVPSAAIASRNAWPTATTRLRLGSGGAKQVTTIGTSGNGVAPANTHWKEWVVKLEERGGRKEGGRK